MIGVVLSGAKVALANGGVTIRRHDRHDVHVEVVKLSLGKANGFSEQFFVRVAQLVESLSRLRVTFSAVECEPFGFALQELLVVSHAVQPVRGLPSVRLSQSKSEAPHHDVVTVDGSTKVENPHREVGPLDPVDFR